MGETVYDTTVMHIGDVIEYSAGGSTATGTVVKIQPTSSGLAIWIENQYGARSCYHIDETDEHGEDYTLKLKDWEGRGDD